MKDEEVKKIAELARIEISAEEARAFASEIESILSYVSEIQSVATTGNMEREGECNVVREDGEPHESGVYTEALLAGAPQTERGYVKVKKIL
jgi:aspartyl-tRNA(Asn)/glutamyl-tRNA(Gln) amidotransferase subunit C